MRVGVVSDTHNNLPNVAKIIDIFNRERVDRVVHTGDITQPKTLAALARLDAPLFGVYGNNDLERQGLEREALANGFHVVDPPLRLHWHEQRIVVVHEPAELERFRLPTDELALFGHTHRKTIVREDGCLIFNPGECAGQMVDLNAIGIVDLTDLAVEILNF